MAAEPGASTKPQRPAPRNCRPLSQCFSTGYDAIMPATIDDILNSHRTGRAVVMGILNVTPDSFADGGDFADQATAAEHIKAMVAQGADIIDIGAESTRPGAGRITPDEQIARLGSLVSIAAQTHTPVSIDTTSSEVAAFALDEGAAIINDVSAGRGDPGIFALAAERKTPMVLMHMLGEPKSMQDNPQYDDVVTEVRDFLAWRIDQAAAAGVPHQRIIIDPGIGFGKLLEHNVALLRGLPALLELGRPVLIGASRKRFIGELTGQDSPAERLGGSVAVVLATWTLGATIFRVHDVEPTVQALKVAGAIRPHPLGGMGSRTALQ